MSLLVTHARLITVPAGTEDPGYVEDGWMLVGDDGRIAALGAGTPPVGTDADETLDVAGAFVAPGFVSSHSHLFTSGLRGLGVADTLYGWCDAMLGTTAHMSADQLYWATLHGSLDFLSNGVTTAYNFTDPLQAWEPMVDGKRTGTAGLRGLEYHWRQAEGTRDSGIRFVDAAGMDVTAGTPDEDTIGNGVATLRPSGRAMLSMLPQVQRLPSVSRARIWFSVRAIRTIPLRTRPSEVTTSPARYCSPGERRPRPIESRPFSPLNAFCAVPQVQTRPRSSSAAYQLSPIG